MPSSPDRTKTLVRKAIGHAARIAPDDDAGFVRELRAFYFAEAGDDAKAVPPAARSARAGAARSVRAGAAARSVRAGAAARSVRAEPARSMARAAAPAGSTPIYDDPRFLKNAKMLAEETRGGTRIMGGTAVRGSEFDDCVAVGDDAGFCCTGTLIAPQVVITAGHCTDGMTRVFVGNDIDRRGREYRVGRAVRHPDYEERSRPEENLNDLLVLVLEEPMRGVTPRKLATTAAIDRAPYGRAVGFGSNESTGFRGYGIKRQVDVPITSNDCNGRVGGRTDRVAYGCRVQFEMVAAKNVLSRDTCKGDSGGPLYVGASSGTWRLAAVTSRATLRRTSMCGDGGIYVRIDRYIPWIEKVASIRLPRR